MGKARRRFSGIPQWRRELRAEIDAHQAIGMKPAQLGPQVAGLVMDISNCLRHDERMLRYARRILTEAEHALPYGEYHEAGYQPRRQHLSDWVAVVSDVDPVARLARRWHDSLLVNLTVAVFTVRRLIRLHDLRHGAYTSPWAAGFLESVHAPVVAEMRETLRRGQRGSRS